MLGRVAVRGGLVLLTWLLFTPAQASAKGVIFITYGDTITHLGDPLPQPDQRLGWKVGYKSSYWGLFWIDLWTWGGEFCLYEGNTFQPIDHPTAARLLGKPESELKEPFLYRYPLGLVILGGLAVLLIPLAIAGFIVEAREKAKAATLVNDPLYQKALEIASAPAVPIDPSGSVDPNPNPATPEGTEDKADSGPAFEAGLKCLTGSGVPPQEAERNLKLVLRHAPVKPKQA